MVNTRPGYLSYRRRSSCILTMYNPHRFARQHSFLQLHPGTPHKHSIPMDAQFMYNCWLSLTRTGSQEQFEYPHPSSYQNIQSQVDPAYRQWWDSDVLPLLNVISIETLSKSETSDFPLKPIKDAPLQTKRKKKMNGDNLDSLVLTPAGESISDERSTTKKLKIKIPSSLPAINPSQ